MIRTAARPAELAAGCRRPEGSPEACRDDVMCRGGTRGHLGGLLRHVVVGGFVSVCTAGQCGLTVIVCYGLCRVVSEPIYEVAVVGGGAGDVSGAVAACCIYAATSADYTASLGRSCRNPAAQRAYAVKVEL